MYIDSATYDRLERKGLVMCLPHGTLYTSATTEDGKGCGKCVVDRRREYGADLAVGTRGANGKQAGKAKRAQLRGEWLRMAAAGVSAAVFESVTGLGYTAAIEAGYGSGYYYERETVNARLGSAGSAQCLGKDGETPKNAA